MHRVGGDHAGDRSAVLVEQVKRIKRYRRACGAAHGDAERIVAHYFEFERTLLGHPVERSAVGAGNFLRRHQDRLEQPVDIGFLRQRDADLVELFESLEQIGRIRRTVHLIHGGRYLIQTARTCAMSVTPSSTFSMPSCFSVRMPCSSAVANISATRACS